MQTNETLVGRIEIEDLVKKYCLYFDTNQPEKLVDLFSEDACIDYGPEVAPLKSKPRPTKPKPSSKSNSRRPAPMQTSLRASSTKPR